MPDLGEALRATAAVLTGQADFSGNVSLETHAEGLKRKDIVGTVRYPGEFNSYQVHINNERKPFNDPRVRRAINLAVRLGAVNDEAEFQILPHG